MGIFQTNKTTIYYTVTNHHFYSHFAHLLKTALSLVNLGLTGVTDEQLEDTSVSE